MNTGPSCFGFYSGQAVCRVNCQMVDRCKSIVNTHGLDIVSDCIDQMMAELPTEGRVPVVQSLRSTIQILAAGRVMGKVDPDGKSMDPGWFPKQPEVGVPI